MEKELSIMQPDAAGIDIGSEVHYVCVPQDRSAQYIKKFSCFTSDIINMSNWLKQCKIKTVAMESTGVYWIPVFQILESIGVAVNSLNISAIVTPKCTR